MLIAFKVNHYPIGARDATLWEYAYQGGALRSFNPITSVIVTAVIRNRGGGAGEFCKTLGVFQTGGSPSDFSGRIRGKFCKTSACFRLE